MNSGRGARVTDAVDVATLLAILDILMPNTDTFAAPLTMAAGTTSTSLRRAGLNAVVFAAAGNAAFYLLTSQFGFFPQWVLIPGADAPIGLGRVIVVTALCVAVAVGVYGWMRRRLREPARVFRWTALVVLILSFTQPPLVLANAPLRMIVALDVMHVIATAVVLGVLGVGAGADDAGR